MDATTTFSLYGALFAEDFDQPEALPKVAEIEPTFAASDVAAAREAAWREGYAAGLQNAAEGDAAATRQAMTAIAEQLAAQREMHATQAEQSAEAIARLLLDSMAAVFPALCARHGDAEMRAIVRAVLPGLTQEQAITVRAHPRSATTLAQEVARLEPDLVAHVQIIECDAMPPGDVRIAWRGGSATRDALELWQQVASVLMPAELLSADTTIRETIDGD